GPCSMRSIATLGNFERVEEVKAALQNIRVVSNKDLEKVFGAPTDLHHVVTDSTGSSIVIEYTNGELNIYDNIGVMTNSPSYDWHLLNVRNYTQLRPFGQAEPVKVGDVELKPFGLKAFQEKEKKITSTSTIHNGL
ncbi:hypothetical protein CGI23_24910, partial [Vibrio parahaemolyticus]|uniref:linear amide C-N hydrolase n=1 Tax=Vibrio parahaemolyticus TaxID=670 RepID=UPI00112339FB